MKRIKIKQTEDQKVWITSDLHGFHKNIVGGETEWIKFPTPFKDWSDTNERDKFCIKNGVRPFRNISEMNDIIINNINSSVKENDILFNLGDWTFGKENAKQFRDRILCNNILSLFGNHDLKNLKDEKPGFQQLEHYMEVEIDGILVCLSHYKMYAWNRKGKEKNSSIHLYGHSHSNLEHIEIGRSMDAGIDNAYKILGEYRPFSFDEIYKILEKRNVNHFRIDGKDINTRGDHHSE